MRITECGWIFGELTFSITAEKGGLLTNKKDVKVVVIVNIDEGRAIADGPKNGKWALLAWCPGIAADARLVRDIDELDIGCHRWAVIGSRWPFRVASGK